MTLPDTEKSTGSAGALKQPSNFPANSHLRCSKVAQQTHVDDSRLKCSQQACQGHEEFAIMTANRNKYAAHNAPAKCTQKVKWRQHGKSYS